MSAKENPPLYRAFAKKATRLSRWNQIWLHLRQFQVSADARFLFAIIATYSNKDGECCFPSLSTLLKATGWAENTFYKRRKELTDIGWVATTPRLSKNGRESTLYKLHFLRPENIDAITAKIEATPTAKFEDRDMSRPSVLMEEPTLHIIEGGKKRRKFA